MKQEQTSFLSEEVNKTNEKESEKNLPILYAEGYLEDLEVRPNFSVEANFMFLPIFSFDRHLSNQRSKITHSIPIKQNGAVSTSTLSISTAEVFSDGKSINPGLPGSFDMQVLFCLMDLWDEQGKSVDGLVKFNLITILRRLNLTKSGRTFSEIRNSIKKLTATKLQSVNAFYSSERATFIDATAGILESHEFISHKAGAGKSAELCQVTLSKFILKNLLNNYQGRIDRKLYQSLDNGFAQRLFSIFQYRIQFQKERTNVDFELMDLAAILPMSGKLYPSKIKDRLQSALTELNDKMVLKHEFIKVGSRTVLRLNPFNKPKVFLDSEDAINLFVLQCEKVYKTNPIQYFEIDQEVFKRLVLKYSKNISFNDNKYNWCIHVFDVALFMIAFSNYRIENKSAWIKSLLDKTEIDYPINFKPVDIQYTNLETKAEVTLAIAIKDSSEKDAEDELFRVAMGYVDRLKPESLEKYKNKIREKNPLFKNLTGQFEIAELIAEDMKVGIDVSSMLDETKLKIQRKSQLITIDGAGNT